MTIDLFLVSLVVVFALLGALSGASRQLANVVALVAGYAAAHPGGALLGPPLAAEVKGLPVGLGIVAATVVVFLVVMAITRMILVRVFKRLLGAGDPEARGLDRGLGFLLGGTKVALVAWVLVCALTFVEDNVALAGRKLGIATGDSVAFAFSRRYNLFELTRFSDLRDFAKVASATADPQQAQRLSRSPGYQQLRVDPRFKKALADRPLRAALKAGDHRALLRSDAVMELLDDPAALQKVREAALAVQQ